MVKKITEKEFSEVKNSKVAVVDFSAVWCGPCQMLAPVMEELSDELDGKADFYNVDVDENPSLAMQFGIQSIPALVVLKDGVKADMQVGFMPKAMVSSFIEKHI